MSTKRYAPKYSKFFIRIDNYMPLVYDCDYLYIHQDKGVFEFKPSRYNATMFETKYAIIMIERLIELGYEKYNLKAIDLLAD